MTETDRANTPTAGEDQDACYIVCRQPIVVPGPNGPVQDFKVHRVLRDDWAEYEKANGL